MISLFTMHFFVPLAFVCSASSFNFYAYALALSAQNSTMLFPPNSSLKRPITFLFLPIGRGLLSFFYHNLKYQTIFQHH